MPGWMVISVLLTSFMLNSSAIASPLLPAPVFHYDAEDDNPALQHKTAKDIIPKITLQGQIIRFEKNTLSDIQQALKGDIHHTQRTDWICFYSPGNRQTWWFLSDNMMQHGYLSGVAIYQNRSSQYCTETDKPLSVIYSVPGPGVQRQMLSRYFGIPVNITSKVSFYSEQVVNKKATQLNSLQYYFKDDKVTEILFSQVTTL